MSGIPPVTSKADGDDVCWPWAGLFDLDPVEKLGIDLAVLPSAAQYFMRESSRNYSLRVRVAHDNATLHLIWEIKRAHTLHASVSKIRTLLKTGADDFAFNLVRGYDGLKVTSGFIKRTAPDWGAIVKITEIVDYVSSDHKRMLSAILDVSR